MKKICFRVDANSDIGQGHVMRCLAIADYAKKYEIFDSIFIVSNIESGKLCIDRGYVCDSTRQDDYREYSIRRAEEMKRVIEKYNVSAIFIDSYDVTAEYIRTLGEIKPIICFYSRYDVIKADIIINYNINVDIDIYQKQYQNIKNKLLLGSKYIPLREEFMQTTKPIYRTNIERILVMTGGGDPYNIADMMQYVAKKLPQCQFMVVKGQYATQKQKETGLDNINYIQNTDSISEIMRDSDIVISAGGTTMYELCALRIPTIVYTMADNQKSETEYLYKLGCVDYIGDVRENENFTDYMLEKIKKYIYCPEKTKDMVDKMKNVVDGNGCSRIVKSIASIIY